MFGDRREDLLAVRLQGLVLGVVLQVDRELVHAETVQLLEATHVVGHRPEDAEAVDDVVGTKAVWTLPTWPCSL